MGFNLPQEQYAEFVRIWQRSGTANEALQLLQRSDNYPDTYKQSWQYRTQTDPNAPLSLAHIQAVARALREFGSVPLKKLKSSRSTHCGSDYVDFAALRQIANTSRT